MLLRLLVLLSTTAVLCSVFDLIPGPHHHGAPGPGCRCRPPASHCIRDPGRACRVPLQVLARDHRLQVNI